MTAAVLSPPSRPPAIFPRMQIPPQLQLLRRLPGLKNMTTIGIFLLWCLLLAVCWPLALLALVLAPIAWLIALPFRLLGVCVEATFSLIKTLLFLPTRLLGGTSARSHR